MNDSGQEQVVVGASAIGTAAARGAVLIAPWGQVRSSNGDFVLDADAGGMVVEAFRAHGTDLPIDYEHQSLGGTYASPTGQAPAAGWIKSLRVVLPNHGESEPGLYADVEWTEAAQGKLQSREYRYLSPVVIVRKRDRRMVALHSAALTNKPAIVGMRPIVNKEEGEPVSRNENEIEQETSPNEGQAETTAHSEGVIETPVASEPEKTGEAVEVLRLRLGLEEGADKDTIILTAERRLADLMAEANRREAEERVINATRAGKLIPVQREWAMALALTDPAGFDEWAATAPVVVSLGRTQPPAAASAGSNKTAIVASARAAYRAEPSLALLTSEEAWIAQAMREGMEQAGSLHHNR